MFMQKNMDRLMPSYNADGIVGGAGGSEGEGEAVTFDEVIAKNEEYKKAYDAALAATKEDATREAKALLLKEQEQVQKQDEIDKLPTDKKQEELLKEAIKRAETLEKEKNIIILKQNAGNFLLENDLSVKFVDFVVGENEKTTKENVVMLKSIFDEVVAAAVKDKLPGYTPKSNDRKNERSYEDEIAEQLFGK